MLEELFQKLKEYNSIFSAPLDLQQKFFSELIDYLYSHAYALVLSKYTAEDLTSQSILQFVKQLKKSKKLQFESVKKLKAYLLQILRNEHRKYIAKQKNVVIKFFSEIKQMVKQKLKEGEYQEEEILAQEETQMELQLAAERLLSYLEDTDRQILTLRFWEGYSLSEIAEILQISYAACRKRYSRAIKKLKQLLSQNKAKND